jgi:hypothetical protein
MLVDVHGFAIHDVLKIEAKDFHSFLERAEQTAVFRTTKAFLQTGPMTTPLAQVLEHNGSRDRVAIRGRGHATDPFHRLETVHRTHSHGVSRIRVGRIF